MRAVDPIQQQNTLRGFKVAGWLVMALSLMILLEVLSEANRGSGGRHYGRIERHL